MTAVTVVRSARHAVALRLESEQPAARGRNADRAGAVDTQRRRYEPGGDGGRGAAAGATRRALVVPRIAGHPAGEGLGERPQSELGHRGLADEHRSGVAQPPDHLGVRGRRRVEGAGSTTRDLAFEVKLVLDRDRYAEQRALLPTRATSVRSIGFGPRLIRIHGDERTQLGVERVDAIEGQLDQFTGRDLAASHELRLDGDAAKASSAVASVAVIITLSSKAGRSGLPERERRVKER